MIRDFDHQKAVLGGDAAFAHVEGVPDKKALVGLKQDGASNPLNVEWINGESVRLMD